MGAATIVAKRKQVTGNRVRQSFDLTLSASYATNGDTLAASELAKIIPDRKTITDLNFVDIVEFELGAAGHALYLDRTNLKVKAFNGITEIANATNLATVVIRGIIEYGDDPSSSV
jgi:hypothetical protein